MSDTDTTADVSPAEQSTVDESTADGSTTDESTTEQADEPEIVLEVEDLQKSFGGLVATDHATFEVERGTITGLIGPNGAGKSTIFNLISGFYESDGGTVTVNGTDVTNREPYEVAEQGLIRTFQTPRKLEGMTVREAMLIGPRNQPGESFLTLFTDPATVNEAESANLADAQRILEEFEIDHLATQPATDISGGQMKLVELARAMLAEPEILLLDEPVAGVNPTLRNTLAEQIRRLNEQGTTFLLIEHDMEFVMSLADPVVVLNQGSVLMEGKPDEVQSNDRVIEAYLGGGT
ncbi:amino acid/amide ABC transporter ATP-binding protein 1 (HAAT family) [Halohasta litchfieldiae]|jgi:branched-chain amino acid transport system ATP-binding protein|uniref:Probable branched-chain amino acid transport ATP-binding protein LivG n=1 Tax=Halohasta litchfieldiae TaxID=1073996 RepID=A0A1H6WWU8_9EURY|nr:ABC transporter ATP-binding protein [Halohasta litchfieldiae]ATW89194.1 amino acid/amide ABC transporter ATP-binding protein 1 (HAAT family) [Halohasta litchfieldiae]SEJ19774.1 amino acid/amide ABC transporter ATP-binding protein 1, HAAT family [Halohasta litchfieldiae]